MVTLFGGKGGVGKTTCAASWSVARAAAGTRVLILSTDPAHSLADVFDRPLRKHVATRIAPRLDALEVDSASAVRQWLERSRPALAELLERGTLLDAEDVDQVLALPIPGLDELAAFIAIAGRIGSGHYDELVIDTAPTGHALRLLETPRLVGAFTDLLQAMHDRHAMVAEALGGAAGTSVLVEELRRSAADFALRLHDRTQTQMVWVTLPEPLAVAETLAAIAWLQSRQFPLASTIVNRTTPRSPDARCAECRARLAFERAVIEPLIARLRLARPAVVLRKAPSCEREPRGLPALRTFGQRLTRMPLRSPLRAGIRNSARFRLDAPEGPRDGAAVLNLSSGRLLFFGGKGGVGKTTCAVAAALAIAARFPHRAIRVLSTDPAPSLGEALLMPVGDSWVPVAAAGRIEARELDASARFDAYRGRYQHAVEAFFDDLTGGSSIDATADRAVFERLFDLAPPGVDELIGLLTVVDILEMDRDSLVIVDTAPTGHAIRLLSAQDDLRRWVALLMRVLLKYRLASRAETFARELVELSRRLRAFAALLRDPDRAQFVTVVRPAALPRLETARLLGELRRLDVRARTIVVNAGSRGSCRACLRRTAAELRQVHALRRSCRGPARRCDIIHAPLQLPPPRGAAELLHWSTAWRSDGDE